MIEARQFTLVTGGSAGIGRAICEALAATGERAALGENEPLI